MRNYERFLRDYMEENDPESFSLLEQIDVFDEDGKEGVYKENYYFKEHLQLPKIAPVLALQKNRDFIVDFVGRFIDSHSYQLSTPGPVRIFTFGEKELKPIYNMFSINNEELLSLYDGMVQETYYGKISKVYDGLVKNVPQKILFNAMLCDAFKNDYMDIIECVEYMYAFTEYPIIYRDFWKIGVKEDVMNYTIEHLGSKYKIREMKNLQELLKYDATKSVTFFEADLTKGVDNVYMDLIYRMRNQIHSKMKNIAREYFANVEKNATQHTNISEFDDGELADQEGHASNMASIIDSINTKFKSNGINVPLVKIAADGSKVDKSNLEGMINNIYGTKNNRMDKLVENIITAYFKKNPTDWTLNSREFLNFGLSLYRSIGTSKDPILMEIKNILSYWMNDIINIRSMYQREPTVISYTRAVFNYVVLMINYFI